MPAAIVPTTPAIRTRDIKNEGMSSAEKMNITTSIAGKRPRELRKKSATYPTPTQNIAGTMALATFAAETARNVSPDENRETSEAAR